MRRIFSLLTLISVVIIVLMQGSCGQKTQTKKQLDLSRWITDPFFKKMINSDAKRDSICRITNFTDQSYLNDSIGINIFIATLLCANAHITPENEYEFYFGTDTISKLDLNSSTVYFSEFDSLEEYKKPLYISAGLQFLKDHLQELNHRQFTDSIGNAIVARGGYMDLFYMILSDVRKNKYKNLDQYTPNLIELYNYLSQDDHLLGDMILDVIRRSHDPAAFNFLKGKYFLSDDFNSKEFIHAYDSIGDKGYIKYVKQQK